MTDRRPVVSIETNGRVGISQRTEVFRDLHRRRCLEFVALCNEWRDFIWQKHCTGTVPTVLSVLDLQGAPHWTPADAEWRFTTVLAMNEITGTILQIRLHSYPLL